VAITTDVIVGFPGETDAEFEESYRLCQETGFARTHVFPYSPRPGTEAASLPDRVAERVKKVRARKMLSLAEESSLRFRRRYAGKARPVLWESSDGKGKWTGFTDNYIQVQTTSDDDLTNRMLIHRMAEGNAPSETLSAQSPGVQTQIPPAARDAGAE
jgi:threonylcarbamoyladenosine tRNA methylthiotransferase MtaB